MMSKSSLDNGDAGKPYPRRCAACGEVGVRQTQIEYDAEVRHDGKLHAFRIPLLEIDQCGDCGEQYFTSVTDDLISLGLRQHLGLLCPNEIRSGLKKCSVNQRTFADHLGIAAETVSRWLNGSTIQTRSLDRMMRLYFAIPSVRHALAHSEIVSDSPTLSEDAALAMP